MSIMRTAAIEPMVSAFSDLADYPPQIGSHNVDSQDYLDSRQLGCSLAACVAWGGRTAGEHGGFWPRQSRDPLAGSAPERRDLCLRSGADDNLVHINVGRLLDRERNSA